MEQVTTAFAPLIKSLVETLKLIAVFAPVHQAFIEVFKLRGRRVKYYYEALAYIVYGISPDRPKAQERLLGVGPNDRQTPAAQEAAPEAANTIASAKTQLIQSAQSATASRIKNSMDQKSLGFVEQWIGPERLVPATLGAGIQREWVSGAQRNIVEAFALRALGDSPVAEISDADIQNVIQVVRQAAPIAVRRTIETLNMLLEGTEKSREAVVSVLERISPQGELKDTIAAWIRDLNGSDALPVNVVVAGWRRDLIETHLIGEIRARVDLANSLKSAEYRYHGDIRRASAVLAAVESVLLMLMLSGGNLLDVTKPTGVNLMLVGLMCFGFLVVLSQASKSVLDIIVGFAGRIKL